MGGFNIPDSDSDIVQSPQGYISCFLNFAFGVVCDIQDLYSLNPVKILFCLAPPIVLRLGQTHYFIWRPYAAKHGMVLI